VSPDWAGWIVLHAMLLAAFVGGGCFLVLAGLRGAWRWWLARRWHRW
jgi:hypothetical protein